MVGQFSCGPGIKANSIPNENHVSKKMKNFELKKIKKVLI